MSLSQTIKGVFNLQKEEKDIELKASELLRPIELASDGSVNSIIDILSPGVFYDMYGYDVVIEEGDIEAYIFNTSQAISRTVTNKGSVVGLPIDELNHSKGLSCGRIKSVFEGVGLTGLKIVQGEVEWNDLGIELIGTKRLCGFSPTARKESKIILGGSLTNWPASVDGEGKLLLRPVELSQAETNGDNDMTPEEIQSAIEAALNEKLAGTVELSLKRLLGDLPVATTNTTNGGNVGGEQSIVELFGGAEHLAEVQAELRKQFVKQYEVVKNQIAIQSAELIAKINHEQNVQQLCELATTGKQGGYAVPEKAENIREFALGLNQKQYKFFESFLSNLIDNGMIDLRELGSSVNQESKEQLPEYIAKELKAGKIKVADLYNPVLNLGDVSKYDLSAYAA